jgi:hypothetical protein
MVINVIGYLHVPKSRQGWMTSGGICPGMFVNPILYGFTTRQPTIRLRIGLFLCSRYSELTADSAYVAESGPKTPEF